MNTLGCIHDAWKEYELAFEWYTKGAESGLPVAMFSLAVCLDKGEGVAVPDYPAAAGWYRRAADLGNGDAANNLATMFAVGRGRDWQIMPIPASPSPASQTPRFSGTQASRDAASIMCQTLGRGVTRSKRQAMHWLREAANAGNAHTCAILASTVYHDQPYARVVGRVVEAAEVAMMDGVVEGHDVPPDVLNSVVHWLRKGGYDSAAMLDNLRREALEGGQYCVNEGCEFVGHQKDFKVCPQCKIA